MMTGIRWTPVGCALLMALFLGGCAPRIITTLVHEGPVVEVRLQQTIGSDKKPVDQGYDHPIVFSDIQVEKLLNSVQVDHQPGFIRKAFTGSRREIGPVFTEKEVREIRGALSVALAAATSADRVNFVFRHRRGILSAGITTGVMVVKENHLEILLGNYRATLPSIAADPHAKRRDPLMTFGRQTFKLVPGPFQEIHETDDRNLEDRWIRINYKTLLDSIREPKSESPKVEDGLESKLETLKRVREKGLITEEEYLEKKADLLRQF